MLRTVGKKSDETVGSPPGGGRDRRATRIAVRRTKRQGRAHRAVLGATRDVDGVGAFQEMDDIAGAPRPARALREELELFGSKLITVVLGGAWRPPGVQPVPERTILERHRRMGLAGTGAVV